ncbi:hypothetical protein [Mycobacterium genavense]|uniref:hypothetical protein n=1 Tax=Mycobacterium genavense TaxID=36812 RepID=UPI000471C1CF|nr:hypothetical protein [Mycobacterium genavense]
MRRAGPLLVVVAVTAVMLAVVGCDTAGVHAKETNNAAYTASRRELPQANSVQLLFDGTTVSRAPQTEPSPSLVGLQARLKRATDDAAANCAALSAAVLDRNTHQLVVHGNPRIAGTASVAKLFIADDLLMQQSQSHTMPSDDDQRMLSRMLQSSDDQAAEKFWNQRGGSDIITRVATRYRLTSTGPPRDGRWWNTTSTVTDLIRYYEMLLEGSGELPAQQAAVIIDNLAKSTPRGDDGYPQRFGIPDGLPAEPVAVKQGWMCCLAGAWVHLSTGVIGEDHRYIMVVESLQAADDATARATITQAVRTMFPDGRI